MKRALFFGLMSILLSGCVADGGDAAMADEPLLSPQDDPHGNPAQCGSACNGGWWDPDGAVLNYFISPELITVDSSDMTFTVSSPTGSTSCPFSSNTQVDKITLDCKLDGMTGNGQLFFHSKVGPMVATIPMVSTDPIDPPSSP